MAKKKQRFELSDNAKKTLEKYLREIRKSITIVCEMHTHDSAPSLKQKDFEEAYIEKILGQTATVIRLSIKSMTEGLAAQKAKELQEALQGENPEIKKEDK